MPIDKTLDVPEFNEENIVVLKDLLDKIVREAATDAYVDASVLWETNSSGNVALKTADDIDFQDKQSKNFIIENRTDDTGCTQTGRFWFRTDL